jgi:hypothetical protein
MYHDRDQPFWKRYSEAKDAFLMVIILFGLAFVIGFVSFIDTSRSPKSTEKLYERAASVLLQDASPQQCDSFLYNMTRVPSMAGGTLELAQWIQKQMVGFGLTDTRLDQYDVLLSLPTNLNRVQLIDPQDPSKILRDLDLYEKPISQDPTSSIAKEKIPTFVSDYI